MYCWTSVILEQFILVYFITKAPEKSVYKACYYMNTEKSQIESTAPSKVCYQMDSQAWLKAWYHTNLEKRWAIYMYT